MARRNRIRPDQETVPARPDSPPISEEMKAWSDALAKEIADWPDCSARSFFGFTALYCGARMFGVLPRTRAVWTPNTLAFKFENANAKTLSRLKSDPRIGSTRVHDARWFTFQIDSNEHFHDVLGWLAEAYNAARKYKK